MLLKFKNKRRSYRASLQLSINVNYNKFTKSKNTKKLILNIYLTTKCQNVE